MRTRTRALAIAAIGVAIALFAVACSDNATSENNAQQSDVEEINARIQRNEVLMALQTIGGLPLHDMDESIAAGTIDGKFLPNARTAIRFIALTNWPDDLKSDAAAVQEHAVALAAALEDGDVEAAKDPAHELHEGWHDFSETAWANVGADLPEEAGTQPHDGGDETPAAADGTPSSSETADH